MDDAEQPVLRGTAASTAAIARSPSTRDSRDLRAVEPWRGACTRATMRFLRAASLLLFFLAFVACGAERKAAPSADPSARFEGQAIGILLFDKSNGDCWRDLGELTSERLRTCVGDALPAAQYEITRDPNAFDPDLARHMAFVTWGPGVDDPTFGDGPEGYLAVIGLGPLPRSGDTLMASSVRPRSLVDNTGSLINASGAPMLGGQAIVSNGGQTLTSDQSQPIVKGTQQLLEQQADLLCPSCGPDPASRMDTGHSHWPCAGDHIHTFVWNQNPSTCQCFQGKGPVICL